MSAATVIPPGEGELLGDAPDRRVEILSEHESLHATWSRFGPGREGADLHIHRGHTDFFYVLEGELTVRLGVEDRAVPAPAGTLVRVPPFVAHGFRNAGERELRFLNLHAPGVGFVDYMRGLRDRRPVPFDQEPPPPEGVRPPSEAHIGEPRADVAAIAVAERAAEPGAPSSAAQEDGRDLLSLYVLEGELRLELDGGEVSAEGGTWVQLPPGAGRVAAGPARYLEIRTPEGRGP